jgi:hypothetical protein
VSVRDWALAFAVALALALVACGSPEATRTRGGGPGADTGNRGELVEMHEGAQPYWGTPQLLADELRAPAVAAGARDRPEAPAASPRR